MVRWCVVYLLWNHSMSCNSPNGCALWGDFRHKLPYAPPAHLIGGWYDFFLREVLAGPQRRPPPPDGPPSGSARPRGLGARGRRIMRRCGRRGATRSSPLALGATSTQVNATLCRSPSPKQVYVLSLSQSFHHSLAHTLNQYNKSPNDELQAAYPPGNGREGLACPL